MREKDRRIAEVGENDQIYKIRMFAEIEADEKTLHECEELLQSTLKRVEEI